MAKTNGKGKKDLVQEVLTDDPDFIRLAMEEMFQDIIETQMTEQIGAEPYKRSSKRKSYRNGYKPQILRPRNTTLPGTTPFPGLTASAGTVPIPVKRNPVV